MWKMTRLSDSDASRWETDPNFCRKNLLMVPLNPRPPTYVALNKTNPKFKF